MPATRKKADYHEKTSISEFIGNPLISALPEAVPQNEMLKNLFKHPPFKKEERFKETYDRLQLLSRICTVHVPFSQDLFIARSLSRCIYWGYVSRNPMPFSVTANVLSAYQIDVTQDMENYLTHTVFPIYGFSVLGISGVGKSSSVLNALRQYTQIIEHETYADQPFKCSQLVWLKVDCPGDGTPKGLCTTILREVDAVLGTQYTSEIYSRISKDTLISMVARCLSSHHLGVLVIDDIQNLCGAKKDTSLDMLSFLIYLMESFAIPVVMVGTPKVLTLFQQEFQMAKRATGDGTVRMELLKKDSNDWNRFINGIWFYQFLRNPVDLTPEMNDVFYEESVGNPFLCSLLYKLVQDDAITSNAENFTITDVKKVAEEKLCITATMRKNMLSGNDEELKRYEYLWRSAELPVSELSNPISKPAASDKKSETLSYLVKKLTENKSINIAEAAKLAQIAMEAKPGCSKDELLGFARKYYDSTKPSAENQQPPSGSEHPLTES